MGAGVLCSAFEFDVVCSLSLPHPMLPFLLFEELKQGLGNGGTLQLCLLVLRAIRLLR